MKILAVAGSYRAGSLNRKLLALGVRELQAQGAEVDVMDLKALALPMYDGDVEAEAFPPAALDLKERIARAQALFICSPEYNSSIPAGLKNAIDWASRPPSNPFKGKLAACLGATTGMYGTIRMQPHLRQVLFTLGTDVVPSGLYLARAEDAFDAATGELKDEVRKKDLHRVVTELIAEVKRRAAGPAHSSG